MKFVGKIAVRIQVGNFLKNGQRPRKVFLGNQNQVVRVGIEVEKRYLVVHEIRRDAMNDSDVVDAGDVFVQIHHVVRARVILTGDFSESIVRRVCILVKGHLVSPKRLCHHRVATNEISEMVKKVLFLKPVDVYTLVGKQTRGKHLFFIF